MSLVGASSYMGGYMAGAGELHERLHAVAKTELYSIVEYMRDTALHISPLFQYVVTLSESDDEICALLPELSDTIVQAHSMFYNSNDLRAQNEINRVRGRLINLFEMIKV